MHNNPSQDVLGELFNRLDGWRNLPSYQLERRVDIFFSFYLLEALDAHFGGPMCPVLIPEFPVRIGSVEPFLRAGSKGRSNQSFKIDYLVFSKDLSTAYLVELKTEMDSRNDKQDCYLLAAQQAGIRAILCGVFKLYKHSRAKRKYRCLLRELRQAELIEFAETPGEPMAKVVKEPQTIVVVYIQPHDTKGKDFDPKVTWDERNPKEVITFEKFRETVVKHRDPISKRFAESLNLWAITRAGDVMSRS
jgi:hypothetical protein